MRLIVLTVTWIWLLALSGAIAGEAGCDGYHGPAAKDVRAFADQNGIGDLDQCLFYGDYTADGADDVFVLLYSTGGGNSFDLEAHVFRHAEGRYRPEGDTELFGIEPRDVSFSLNQVEVTMTVPGPGDARCCPTGSRRFVFAMD